MGFSSIPRRIWIFSLKYVYWEKCTGQPQRRFREGAARSYKRRASIGLYLQNTCEQLPSYSNVGSGVSVAKLIYWYPHQSKLHLNWTKQNHCCGQETILQNKIPYFIVDQKSFKSKFYEKSVEVEVDTLQTPSGEDITLILKFHSSFHHQRTFNLYWKGSVSLKSFQFNPKPI